MSEQDGASAIDRTSAFNAVSNQLYKRGVKSHNLAALSRMLGEAQSPKGILARLRKAGVVQPTKMKIGKWAKRHGPNLGELTNAGAKKARDLFPNSPDMQVRLRWKNRSQGQLARVAQAFCAWWSYASAGGSFDLEAVLDGEKPP